MTLYQAFKANPVAVAKKPNDRLDNTDRPTAGNTALQYSLGWIKLVVSFAILALCLPPYYFLWFGWRIISLLLPSDIYVKVDDFFYHTICMIMIFCVEHINGTKIILYGDVESALSKKERVLYLSNHQSYVDFLVAAMLALRQGMGGHLRFILKDSLKYMPLVGFYDYSHGSIHVNRQSFNFDKMLSVLKYLKNGKITSWVVLFPEGTRHCPEAVAKSRKFAKEKGLDLFHHVLLPKHRGLYYVSKILKDNLDALYDVTMVYSGRNGKILNSQESLHSLKDFFLNGCKTIHIHINRIPIEELPAEESEVKQWLLQSFRRKEEILESYYKTDTLPKEHPFSKGFESPPKRLRNYIVLCAFLLCNLIIGSTQYGFSLNFYGLISLSLVGYMWLAISNFRHFNITEKYFIKTK